MVKISEDAALMCEIVLERYIDVLREYPNSSAPEFKAWMIQTAAEIRSARQALFLEIETGVKSVPSDAENASLIRIVAK